MVSYECLWQSARQEAAAEPITRHMWLADTLKPYQYDSNQMHSAQLRHVFSVYYETNAMNVNSY